MDYKIGLERLVFKTLGDRFRTWHQVAGPDAGQTAEPAELDLIIAKCRDCRRIGFHRDVFGFDAQCFC